MQKDELKILLPGEEIELSTGERVTVSPVPFGRLASFEGVRSQLIVKLHSLSLDIADISKFSRFLEVAAEELMAVMGLVIGKERRWFDSILPEDGFAIWAIIVRQSFKEDSKKNLLALVEAITPLFPSASSILSGAATASETSKVTP